MSNPQSEQYFVHLSQDHWTLTNNAHREARQLAKNVSNHLLNSTDLPAFEKRMREVINEINEKHPRCKPLYLWVELEHLSFPDHNPSFIVDGNFIIELIPVKGNYNPEEEI